MSDIHVDQESNPSENQSSDDVHESTVTNIQCAREICIHTEDVASTDIASTYVASTDIANTDMSLLLGSKSNAECIGSHESRGCVVSYVAGVVDRSYAVNSANVDDIQTDSGLCTEASPSGTPLYTDLRDTPLDTDLKGPPLEADFNDTPLDTNLKDTPLDTDLNGPPLDAEINSLDSGQDFRVHNVNLSFDETENIEDNDSNNDFDNSKQTILRDFTTATHVEELSKYLTQTSPKKSGSYKWVDWNDAEVESLGDELQQARRILRELVADSNKSVIWPFMEAVDEEKMGVTDYYETITQPMWLLRMKEKFDSREYAAIGEFTADFRLMIENCFRYNGPDHGISKKAQRLETMLEQKLALLSRELREKTSVVPGETSNDLYGALYRRRTRSIVPHDSSDFLRQLRLEGSRRDREQRRLLTLEKRAQQEALQQEVIDWERRLMGEPRDSLMRAMWEIPHISLFLVLCQEPLNLTEVIHYEVERSFLLARESSMMQQIMTSLLSTPNQRPTLDKKPSMPYRVWEEKLRQRLSYWYRMLSESGNDVAKICNKIGLDPKFFYVVGLKNPLEKHRYHKLSFYRKVWILKGLCDYCVEHHETLRLSIETQPPLDQREYVLGYDHHGDAYIHFPQFCGADLRVYRHKPHPEPGALPVGGTARRKDDNSIDNSIYNTSDDADSLCSDLSTNSTPRATTPNQSHNSRQSSRASTPTLESELLTYEVVSSFRNRQTRSSARKLDRSAKLSRNLLTRNFNRNVRSGKRDLSGEVRGFHASVDRSKLENVDSENDDICSQNSEESGFGAQKRQEGVDAVWGGANSGIERRRDVDGQTGEKVVESFADDAKDERDLCSDSFVSGRLKEGSSELDEMVLTRGVRDSNDYLVDSCALNSGEISGSERCDLKTVERDLSAPRSCQLPPHEKLSEGRLHSVENNRDGTLKEEREMGLEERTQKQVQDRVSETCVRDKIAVKLADKVFIENRDVILRETKLPSNDVVDLCRTVDVKSVVSGARVEMIMSVGSRVVESGESQGNGCENVQGDVSKYGLYNVEMSEECIEDSAKFCVEGDDAKCDYKVDGCDMEEVSAGVVCLENPDNGRVGHQGDKVEEIEDGGVFELSSVTRESETQSMEVCSGGRIDVSEKLVRSATVNETAVSDLRLTNSGVGGHPGGEHKDSSEFDGSKEETMTEIKVESPWNCDGKGENIEREISREDVVKSEKLDRETEKQDVDESESEDEITPTSGDFELVADTVENLRQLVAQFAEPEGPRTKRSKGRQPRKKCVVELHDRLEYLLKELEPWETKLVQATRKARQKLKRESESYVEEEEENQWESDDASSTNPAEQEPDKDPRTETKDPKVETESDAFLKAAEIKHEADYYDIGVKCRLRKRKQVASDDCASKRRKKDKEKRDDADKKDFVLPNILQHKNAKTDKPPSAPTTQATASGILFKKSSELSCSQQQYMHPIMQKLLNVPVNTKRRPIVPNMTILTKSCVKKTAVQNAVTLAATTPQASSDAMSNMVANLPQNVLQQLLLHGAVKVQTMVGGSSTPSTFILTTNAVNNLASSRDQRASGGNKTEKSPLTTGPEPELFASVGQKAGTHTMPVKSVAIKSLPLLLPDVSTALSLNAQSGNNVVVTATQLSNSLTAPSLDPSPILLQTNLQNQSRQNLTPIGQTPPISNHNHDPQATQQIIKPISTIPAFPPQQIIPPPSSEALRTSIGSILPPVPTHGETKNLGMPTCGIQGLLKLATSTQKPKYSGLFTVKKLLEKRAKKLQESSSSQSNPEKPADNQTVSNSTFTFASALSPVVSLASSVSMTHTSSVTPPISSAHDQAESSLTQTTQSVQSPISTLPDIRQSVAVSYGGKLSDDGDVLEDKMEAAAALTLLKEQDPHSRKVKSPEINPQVNHQASATPTKTYSLTSKSSLEPNISQIVNSGNIHGLSKYPLQNFFTPQGQFQGYVTPQGVVMLYPAMNNQEKVSNNSGVSTLTTNHGTILKTATIHGKTSAMPGGITEIPQQTKQILNTKMYPVLNVGNAKGPIENSSGVIATKELTKSVIQPQNNAELLKMLASNCTAISSQLATKKGISATIPNVNITQFSPQKPNPITPSLVPTNQITSSIIPTNQITSSIVSTNQITSSIVPTNQHALTGTNIAYNPQTPNNNKLVLFNIGGKLVTADGKHVVVSRDMVTSPVLQAPPQISRSQTQPGVRPMTCVQSQLSNFRFVFPMSQAATAASQTAVIAQAPGVANQLINITNQVALLTGQSHPEQRAVSPTPKPCVRPRPSSNKIPGSLSFPVYQSVHPSTLTATPDAKTEVSPPTETSSDTGIRSFIPKNQPQVCSQQGIYPTNAISTSADHQLNVVQSPKLSSMPKLVESLNANVPLRFIVKTIDSSPSQPIAQSASTFTNAQLNSARINRPTNVRKSLSNMQQNVPLLQLNRARAQQCFPNAQEHAGGSAKSHVLNPQMYMINAAPRAMNVQSPSVVYLNPLGNKPTINIAPGAQSGSQIFPSPVADVNTNTGSLSNMATFVANNPVVTACKQRSVSLANLSTADSQTLRSSRETKNSGISAEISQQINQNVVRLKPFVNSRNVSDTKTSSVLATPQLSPDLSTQQIQLIVNNNQHLLNMAVQLKRSPQNHVYIPGNQSISGGQLILNPRALVQTSSGEFLVASVPGTTVGLNAATTSSPNVPIQSITSPSVVQNSVNTNIVIRKSSL